ncbi:MAG: DUF177 domain-containing protein [Bdellovibrionales bacterium]
MMSKKQVPEFSRVINVSRIPPKGAEENIEAKPNERKALAERFGLVDLPLLTAKVMVTPERQQKVSVSGTLNAKVVQTCIVTLEPIENSLTLEVEAFFVPAECQKTDPKAPLEIELDDDSEPFSDGKIDIGELVAQTLGIGIDPYPRKKGATLGSVEFGKKAEKQRPFAKLANVVKTKKNKGKH